MAEFIVLAVLVLASVAVFSLWLIPIVLPIVEALIPAGWMDTKTREWVLLWALLTASSGLTYCSFTSKDDDGPWAGQCKSEASVEIRCY